MEVIYIDGVCLSTREESCQKIIRGAQVVETGVILLVVIRVFVILTVGILLVRESNVF